MFGMFYAFRLCFDGLTDCARSVSFRSFLTPFLVRLSISHSNYSAAKSLFFLQELVEVVDGEERIRMLIAEGFALPLQRLA